MTQGIHVHVPRQVLTQRATIAEAQHQRSEEAYPIRARIEGSLRRVKLLELPRKREDKDGASYVRVEVAPEDRTPDLGHHIQQVSIHCLYRLDFEQAVMELMLSKLS